MYLRRERRVKVIITDQIIEVTAKLQDLKFRIVLAENQATKVIRKLNKEKIGTVWHLQNLKEIYEHLQKAKDLAEEMAKRWANWRSRSVSSL